MQDPVNEIRGVIKSLVEPVNASEMLANIDRYWSPNGNIVHPFLNSPKSLGRDGVKAVYQMLRVMTWDNEMVFHAVGFDEETTRKGVTRRTALIDCTEKLKVRLVFGLLAAGLKPTFSPRFLVRVDLIKAQNGLWYVEQQEDNIPTDFGRSGLPGIVTPAISNTIKWGIGMATFATGTAFQYLNLV